MAWLSRAMRSTVHGSGKCRRVAISSRRVSSHPTTGHWTAMNSSYALAMLVAQAAGSPFSPAISQSRKAGAVGYAKSNSRARARSSAGMESSFSMVANNSFPQLIARVRSWGTVTGAPDRRRDVWVVDAPSASMKPNPEPQTGSMKRLRSSHDRRPSQHQRCARRAPASRRSRTNAPVGRTHSSPGLQFSLNLPPLDQCIPLSSALSM